MNILKYVLGLFSKPQITESTYVPPVKSNLKHSPIYQIQNDVHYQLDISKLHYAYSDSAYKEDYYDIPNEYRNKCENYILITNIALNNFYDAYDPAYKMYLDETQINLKNDENVRHSSFRHHPLTDTGRLKKHPYSVRCEVDNGQAIWYFNQYGSIIRIEVSFHTREKGKYLAFSYVISVKYKELQVTNVCEHTEQGKKNVFSLK